MWITENCKTNWQGRKPDRRTHIPMGLAWWGKYCSWWLRQDRPTQCESWAWLRVVCVKAKAPGTMLSFNAPEIIIHLLLWVLTAAVSIWKQPVEREECQPSYMWTLLGVTKFGSNWRYSRRHGGRLVAKDCHNDMDIDMTCVFLSSRYASYRTSEKGHDFCKMLHYHLMT